MSETAKNNPEDLQDVNAAEETAAEDVAAEATEAESEEVVIEDPVAALEAEVAELKDRLLRQAAEVENTRRRAKKDVEDAGNYAITKFARDLLDVGDNLRRALEAAGDTSDADPAMKTLVDGVEMTEKALLKAMEQNGIEKLEPLGEKLDPNKHQAVFEMPNPEYPDGHVAQVMQAGYVLKGRLLRPAMVGVTKNPAGEAPAKEDGPGSNVDTSA
ncbi:MULTISPECIES: nucleotide exchange factor GrpE [Thalassospira]|jgi:molecular chaperone GrpE|uniref:Protein GrpE n=1 Tax=Thalassospira povalilytica TaxID=732237 RepID=A0A8I1M5G6_9PROT|nr:MULTISPECIES: nucleotide exchange factor GrpE [Thalassospira]MEE3047326.1 nucleotide exchange factor GrpE [Pseudomonadota bacterium]MAL39418.1 nucleotide exchange factor GrpE [Thalassospira sp.]MBN8195314.1 nucleotide exchange factor GrpE [Thalassospira povalilytica]MBO6770341.1 nucleotide exchange factor GrpE [Thalassospira sp.]MCC4239877.1 nucleotide exchange factor GrpE [Thalassospira povalilytica]